MERVKVEGLERVAGLLREMADGVEAGVIRLGAEKILCSDDLTAIVDTPEQPVGHVLLVSLSFPAGHHGIHVLAVEKELTHPGG